MSRAIVRIGTSTLDARIHHSFGDNAARIAGSVISAISSTLRPPSRRAL